MKGEIDAAIAKLRDSYPQLLQVSYIINIKLHQIENMNSYPPIVLSAER